jgi:hypothetical protein
VETKETISNDRECKEDFRTVAAADETNPVDLRQMGTERAMNQKEKEDYACYGNRSWQ